MLFLFSSRGSLEIVWDLPLGSIFEFCMILTGLPKCNHDLVWFNNEDLNRCCSWDGCLGILKIRDALIYNGSWLKKSYVVDLVLLLFFRLFVLILCLQILNLEYMYSLSCLVLPIVWWWMMSLAGAAASAKSNKQSVNWNSSLSVLVFKSQMRFSFFYARTEVGFFQQTSNHIIHFFQKS